MNVFGIVGWKNSGKTTLVARLVTEIKSRGYSVSTIKHAHHDFDLDQPGRDSYKHREAGAKEVLISSGKRWALMHELESEDEYCLSDLLTRLSPVDLVLIEGFKSEKHPKIECHRPTSEKPLIHEKDDTIVAIASEEPIKVDTLPVLKLNDTATVADFIISQVGLG
jgi:molybdopterin-guanine dinucleotide biosynthesis protein MobB